MAEICMRQWNAPEKQALSLILINVLLIPNCCSFFGNLYTLERVTPDLKKVEAIKYIQPPINKEQLSSFLGMITYLSQYMSNISYLTRFVKFAQERCIVLELKVHDVVF